MPGPSFIVPDPPNGFQGTAQSEQEDIKADFFGEDIYFDLSKPDATGHADYIITPDGDWRTATGDDALRQSLLRRLITSPDEYKTKPGYGVGVRQYIKARNTSSAQAELTSRIKAQFSQDDRVASVDLVVISPLDDGSPGLKISIQVTPVGRVRQDKPVIVELSSPS